MNLLYDIDKFLRRTNMPPTRFGRLAVRDPRLVGDMRNGREPRAETAERVLAFIASHQAQQVRP